MGQLIFVSKLHMKIQYPRVHASSVMRYTKSMTSGCITKEALYPFSKFSVLVYTQYIYCKKFEKCTLKTKIRLGIWAVHLYLNIYYNICCL